MASLTVNFSEIYPKLEKDVCLQLREDRDYFLIGRYKCADPERSADLWVPDYKPREPSPITSRFHATIVRSMTGADAVLSYAHGIRRLQSCNNAQARKLKER